MTESTIDFPKESLCPEIWDKVVSSDGMKEVWQLKPDVLQKLLNISKILQDAAGFRASSVHVTGSITSNSYTKNADIDLHFLDMSIPEDQADALNKRLREAFKQLLQTDLQGTMVETHPIEVYFQPNLFQDLMSVGCYDVYAKKWLVGPELMDPSFNPYSEYYAEIQKKAKGLSKQIRDLIFSTYEKTIVYKKNLSHPSDMMDQLRNELLVKIAASLELYDNIRNMRKVYSSPKSKEEALSYRTSRKWKIADAAFKLFDKYGYMAILKDFTEYNSLLQASDGVDEEIVESILTTIKKYINNADKLSEKELDEAELLDEGAKEFIASLALSLAVLIPGITSAQTTSVAQKTFNMSQSEVLKKQNLFIDLLAGQNPNKMMNGFKMWQALNITALTLYGEGRGEIRLGGLDPITDTIMNRTAVIPDINRVANVCVGRKDGKAFQYSFWNKNKSALNMIKSGQPILPDAIATNVIERKAWETCLTRATEVIIGNYTVKDKTINSYHVTKMKDPPSWSSKMTNVKFIGHHKFGYLASNSPKYTDMATMEPVAKQNIAKANSTTQKIHIVKKGDNLSTIAKKYNTTVDKLAKTNGISRKDIDRLSIGQKIKI